jgi:hydroxymethylglutaryl-CoA lyase
MRDPGSAAVRIVEVGPRDGLQNVRNLVDTATKTQLIHRLQQAGHRTIELTSFVSPKAIPQLADAQRVLGDRGIKALLQDPMLNLPVLVPNLKGLEKAITSGVKEVAVFVSATEGFSKANINCTVEQGLERARAVVRKATESGIIVRG